MTVFLTVAEILALHRDGLARYGGDVGLLDPGRLEAALAQPPMTFAGVLLHPTLCDQAAAYLFHLVANHAFCDGNKRTGLLATLVFLERNGATIHGSADDWYELTMDIARSAMRKRAVAAVIERLIVQPKKP